MTLDSLSHPFHEGPARDFSKAMTAQEAEAKVREYYSTEICQPSGDGCFLFLGDAGVNLTWTRMWDWTEDRLEEIRQVREEINWLKSVSYAGDPWFIETLEPNRDQRHRVMSQCRSSRILAHEQAVLDSLTRGMLKTE